MQYPVYLDIGPLHMPLHRLFELLAFLLGYRLYVWLRARTQDPLSVEQRRWIFVGAAGGAWLGSHLLGILERPYQLVNFHWAQLFVDKTIVGGLLGGLIGVEYTKKWLGTRRSSGDLMVYPILFGLAVGRLGCHFAGLEDGTHGNPTGLPWGIDFGDGIPRHPVQAYEMLYLGGLAVFLFFQEKRRPLAEGARFKLFMTGYLLWRLALECWKPVWVSPLGLSTLQLAALGGLWYYRKVFLNPAHLFTKQPRSEAAR